VGIVRVMRMLGVALLWVMGVVLVASLSWVAINSAGREVLDTTVTVADPRTGGGSSPLAAATPTPSTVTSLAPPSSISKPDPPASGGRKPGGAISAPAATDTPSGSRPSTPPAHPSEPAPPPSTPAVSPAADTVATSGGVVWLECTGPTITDWLVQPNTGWSAGYAMRGSGELDVRFARKDTNIEVAGTCSQGQPHFDVRTPDHHEGDD
jgi:hypothetical protein